MNLGRRIASALGLSRQRSRRLIRSFEAASPSARADTWGRTQSIAASALKDAATMRPRARDAAINNPLARTIPDALASQIVGTGYRIQSRHSTASRAASLTTEFRSWSSMADADGRRDLTGLLWDAVVAMVIDGEAFLVEVIDGDNHLRWRLVPAEQLDSGRTEQLANGSRVIGGIELDANGVRLAYHFFTSRPGDPLGASLDTVRMPADSVLHLYRPLEPGQLRGVSWLAPVLSMLTSIDRYHDARLMQANVAALVGGFIRDPSGEFTRALAGGEAGPVANISLEPGMFPVLPGDGSVDVVTPPNFTDNGDFVKSHLRAIARAVGLTYEQLSGDLTGVNYSSIRAG